MTKKPLNIKITYRGVFTFLIIFVVIAWIISLPFTSTKVASMTGSDAGAVHGWAEKLYTIGMIALMVILGLSTMIVPIVGFGFFAIAVTLVWHLYRKFQ
jgi:uncharacterized membrane protein